MTLGLWDTAGQEGYKNIRPLSYPGTHVFIICFSLVNYASFENVDSKWYAELTHHCPHVPIILCGTKMDLLENKNYLTVLEQKGEKVVSQKQGEELQAKIKAQAYVPCSAQTRGGVSKVFQAAIIAAIQKPEPVKFFLISRKNHQRNALFYKYLTLVLIKLIL
jgi:Ras-related C3 botulinum toxin substrate 1